MRVCREPGCGELLTEGRRTCPVHRPKTQRADSTVRGYDGRWSIARARYIRAHPLCAVCGFIATDVHHLDGQGPKGPRGYDWSNLQSLCHSCHSSITAREASGWVRA